MRRWALAAFLALSLMSTGCAGGWRRQWIDPARVVERDHPSVLRVHRLDGTSVDVWNPGVAGDSLVAGVGAATGAKPQWVPLQDIDYVEAERPNHTAGILVLGVLLPAAMLGLMAATWE